jgi:hypothetical protein
MAGHPMGLRSGTIAHSLVAVNLNTCVCRLRCTGDVKRLVRSGVNKGLPRVAYPKLGKYMPFSVSAKYLLGRRLDSSFDSRTCNRLKTV